MINLNKKRILLAFITLFACLPFMSGAIPSMAMTIPFSGSILTSGSVQTIQASASIPELGSVASGSLLSVTGSMSAGELAIVLLLFAVCMILLFNIFQRRI